MDDLRSRGLLDSTLIVWMGEFGRTPKINANAGRDHFPAAWTTVLAGGGLKAGQADRPHQRRRHQGRGAAGLGPRLHRHRLPGAGDRPEDPEPLERRPADPDRRPRRQADRGGPRMTPACIRLWPCGVWSSPRRCRWRRSRRWRRAARERLRRRARRRDPGRPLPGRHAAAVRAVSHPRGRRRLSHGLGRLRGPAPSLPRRRRRRRSDAQGSPARQLAATAPGLGLANRLAGSGAGRDRGRRSIPTPGTARSRSPSWRSYLRSHARLRRVRHPAGPAPRSEGTGALRAPRRRPRRHALRRRARRRAPRTPVSPGSTSTRTS